MGKYIFSSTLLLCLLFMSTSVWAQSNKPFTLKIGSYRGNIQWEQSSDRNTWSNVSNGAVASLTVQPIATTYYRAKITEPGCNPVYSDLKAVVIDGSAAVSGRIITGKANLPTGSNITAADLSVMSFIDEQKLKSDGTFELLIPDSTAENMLLVINSKGEVVMMGHYMGTSTDYQITPESTALALLLSYPLLKPIVAAEKPNLVALYKAEPEFSSLISHVSEVVKQGANIYAKANTGIVSSIKTLVSKPFNKNRLKIQQSQFFNPIDIYSHQTSFTVENTGINSYVAGIYKKDNTKVGNSFKIAGSTLDESYILKQIIWSIEGPDEVKTVRSFDLKAMGLQPGEYEIRVRSGLAFDSSPENSAAAIQNASELFSIVIGNVIPDPLKWLDDECIKGVIKSHLHAMNPLAIYEAEKSGNIWTYLGPFFQEIGDVLKSQQLSNCQEIKFGNAWDKFFDALNFVTDYFPSEYIVKWSLNEPKIDGCQFLDSDYKTSNCFILVNASGISQQNATCKEVELKVKAVTDDQYYPNQKTPVSNKNVHWVVQEGRGGFAPEGYVTKTSITDVNGAATIKWIMPDAAMNNLARAFVSLDNKIFSQVLYETKSIVPVFSVYKQDENQTGIIGKPLARPISFYIIDQTINQPLSLDYFTVSYTIKGGGSLQNHSVADPTNTTYVKQWVLGTIVGEQSIDFVVRRKPCIGQTEGAVIGSFTFKATATTGYTLTKVSTAPLAGEVGKPLSTPIVVKVINSDNTPVPNVSIQWIAGTGSGTVTGVTQTNANGEASANWTLGPTVGEQTVTVKALVNGVEVSGSPLVFTSTVVSPNPILITTSPITSITTTSAVSGGSITDDGGNPVTMRGVCWNTSPNPTLSNFYLSSGSGIGAYTTPLVGLTTNKTYYVRAFAINSKGVTYGNEISFSTQVTSHGTFGGEWTYPARSSGVTCDGPLGLRNYIKLTLFSLGEKAWGSVVLGQRLDGRDFDSMSVEGTFIGGVFKLRNPSYSPNDVGETVFNLTLSGDKKSVTGTWGQPNYYSCETNVFTAIIGWTPPLIFTYGEFVGQWSNSNINCDGPLGLSNTIIINLKSQGERAWGTVILGKRLDGSNFGTMQVEGTFINNVFKLDDPTYPSTDVAEVVFELTLSSDKNRVTGTWGQPNHNSCFTNVFTATK